LAELQEADQIDWSRGVADSTKARALGGGDDTGPNPTDRSKLGTKHHVLTDAQGIPLVVTATGANAADVTQLLPLVVRLWALFLLTYSQGRQAFECFPTVEACFLNPP
jgi:hypothetical protein